MRIGSVAVVVRGMLCLGAAAAAIVAAGGCSSGMLKGFDRPSSVTPESAPFEFVGVTIAPPAAGEWQCARDLREFGGDWNMVFQQKPQPGEPPTHVTRIIIIKDRLSEREFPDAGDSRQALLEAAMKWALEPSSGIFHDVENRMHWSTLDGLECVRGRQVYEGRAQPADPAAAKVVESEHMICHMSSSTTAGLWIHCTHEYVPGHQQQPVAQVMESFLQGVRFN